MADTTLVLLACDHPGCGQTTPASAPAEGWRARFTRPGIYCWSHICPAHAEPSDPPLCSRCYERGVSQSQPYLAKRGICSACYQQLWKAHLLPELPRRPRDAVRRDCAHKRAAHQHGTYAAYVLDRCRCDECHAAAIDYERDLRRTQAARQWNKELPATPSDLVPARKARAHLKRLMAAGMGMKTIARKSGIGHGSLSSIIYRKRGRDRAEWRPRRRRITRALEQRILAVTLQLADGAPINPAGTARRLQALVAVGWSQSELARQLGKLPSNFAPLIQGTRQTTVATAAAVRELYDRLWDQSPPVDTARERSAASRARAYAGAHGWVPPMAWDDDTIDDPDSEPSIRWPRKESVA